MVDGLSRRAKAVGTKMVYKQHLVSTGACLTAGIYAADVVPVATLKRKRSGTFYSMICTVKRVFIR